MTIAPPKTGGLAAPVQDTTPAPSNRRLFQQSRSTVAAKIALIVLGKKGGVAKSLMAEILHHDRIDVQHPSMEVSIGDTDSTNPTIKFPGPFEPIDL